MLFSCWIDTTLITHIIKNIPNLSYERRKLTADSEHNRSKCPPKMYKLLGIYKKIENRSIGAILCPVSWSLEDICGLQKKS